MVAAGEASEKGRERESERQRRLRRRCGGIFLCSLKNMEVGKWLEEPLEEWQQRDEMYIREEWRN